MRLNAFEFIILILACSIVILYGLCQTRYPKITKYIDTHKDLNWITVQDVLDQSNNGDLIFFSGNTSGEKTCKYFTDTIFSHVGFLFREIHPDTGEDIAYIFDCDLGQGTKDGVRVLPLRDKLLRYKGEHTGAFKKLIHGNKQRPNLINILDLVGKYSSIDFDDKIATWWFSNISWIYRKIKNEKTMFCSELVALIYQDLGILKRKHVPAWYSPGDFHNHRLDLEEGYSLGETKYFEF